LLAAAGSALILAACQSESVSKTAPSSPGSTSAVSTGQLAQILSKPGHYVAGTDVETGSWVGMALDVTCVYTLNRINEHPGTPQKIPVIGGAPLYSDVTGSQLGGYTTFDLFRGDELALAPDTSGMDLSSCQFWNDGEVAGTPPVPVNSDVPWRDVDHNTNVNHWKMGQFDYLDDVKQRVTNLDESPLTSMGLWGCKMNSRGMATNALQHFANLTNIQADYLVTTAYKHMCPEDAE
jgi:hypothetical protein